jgi:nucleotide-binding universal stress UspA family protein
MQTIITPTDFSEISLNALNYAADMARSVNARLVILHATELSMNEGRTCIEPTDDEIEIEKKLGALRKNILERTANKIPVQSKQVTGFIENEIIKMCEYQNPLAVVMATKGASIKERFFIVSITVHLSKNLRYPVIVVPQGLSYKSINKILLATDLENLYDLPVEKIINVAAIFNAQVNILHVYNNESEFELTSKQIIELNEYLKSLNPQFHFSKSQNVYEAITEFAKNNDVDLIIAFPKKHAFFHKSESKQLIFTAPFAVMTIQ